MGPKQQEKAVILNLIRANLNGRHMVHSAEKRLAEGRNGHWPADTQAWINEHLDCSNWEVRNVAVKLVGEGQFLSFAEKLSSLLTDATQVGFIRRNSAMSLCKLDSVDDPVLKAFVIGLDDSYWEVRTESANGLAIHGKPDSILTTVLVHKIYRKPIHTISSFPIFWPKRIYREKNFEVRAAMFRALGTVMDNPEVIRALEIPLEEDIWKVREAALEAYVKAAQRLGLTSERILTHLSRIDLTCTEFIPTFPIRKTFADLSEDQKINPDAC